MVCKIVKEGSNILRKKAKPVKKITPYICKLLDDMRDTMYDNNGVGLAAPQIGISKQIIVIDTGEGLIEMINPEIIKREGLQSGVEGCLSIPGVVGEVDRSDTIKVKGINREGKEVVYTARGLLSRAFQHEIDHLKGVLFVDLAKNVRKEMAVR